MVIYVPEDRVTELDDDTYEVRLTDFDYRDADLRGLSLYLSAESTGPEPKNGPFRFYLGNGPEEVGDELKAYMSDFSDAGSGDWVAEVHLREV